MTIYNTQKAVGGMLKMHSNFFIKLSGYTYFLQYMQMSRGKNISEIKITLQHMQITQDVQNRPYGRNNQ